MLMVVLLLVIDVGVESGLSLFYGLSLLCFKSCGCVVNIFILL